MLVCFVCHVELFRSPSPQLPSSALLVLLKNLQWERVHQGGFIRFREIAQELLNIEQYFSKIFILRRTKFFRKIAEVSLYSWKVFYMCYLHPTDSTWIPAYLLWMRQSERESRFLCLCKNIYFVAKNKSWIFQGKVPPAAIYIWLQQNLGTLRKITQILMEIQKLGLSVKEIPLKNVNR